MTNITVDYVASELIQLIEREGYLEHEDAVESVRNAFGGDFVYETEAGGLGIIPEVRKAMKKFGGRKYIWSQTERAWRKREKSDPKKGWAVD